MKKKSQSTAASENFEGTGRARGADDDVAFQCCLLITAPRISLAPWDAPRLIGPLDRLLGPVPTISLWPHFQSTLLPAKGIARALTRRHGAAAPPLQWRVVRGWQRRAMDKPGGGTRVGRRQRQSRGRERRG